MTRLQKVKDTVRMCIIQILTFVAKDAIYSCILYPIFLYLVIYFLNAKCWPLQPCTCTSTSESVEQYLSVLGRSFNVFPLCCFGKVIKCKDNFSPQLFFPLHIKVKILCFIS